ncbi:MAG: response regulator [Candidatus Zixiibacteriota bacterium]
MNNKILIIDDEADVVKYLSMVLKANQFEPIAINNAATAMESARKERPALISLDIMMPRETGISFYKKLKSDKALANIPVIIVSGVIQSEKFDFRSYVKDKTIPPPECYMEKPIDVDKYIKTINKLITASDRPQ